MSSWPRRRKRRRDARQRQKEKEFAATVLAIKWLDPEITSAYVDAFAGRAELWRDVLFALIQGTAFAFTTDEGVTLYPRQFYEKVSNALDLLGTETGALFVRAPGQWQTLAPGAPGSRLTSAGPGNSPTWS